MTDELRTVTEALLALYRNATGADARHHESKLRALLQSRCGETTKKDFGQGEPMVEVPGSNLTPYAVLMALDTDPDVQIRKLYHAYARQNHPDATQDHSEGPAWAVATAAYNEIKTVELRDDLARSMGLLSGLCGKCRGTGTVGTRRFKPGPRPCPECKGQGRLGS